jgi:magnesium/cobalt transport protein CorA
MADETVSSGSPGIHVEWFDFGDRSRGRITSEEISSHVAAGRFVWIDVDLRQTNAETLRGQIGGQCGEGVDLGDFAVAHAAAPRRCHSQLLRNNDLIHMRIVNASIDVAKGGRASPPADLLDVVVGNSFLATIRTGVSTILTAVRCDYSRDFEQHASTPSFLIYEIWSRQVEAFLVTENRLEDAVEDLRHLLNESADEVGLTRMSEVSDALFMLRNHALPARRLLEELVSRRTHLISKSTLDFLGQMIGMLDNLMADIGSNREILESAMHLSLTRVTFRTNQTMNRLAVVSTIFLPLTFICGVYGMNFDVMPEIRWQNGYLYFWLLVAVITGTMWLGLRRARLI